MDEAYGGRTNLKELNHVVSGVGIQARSWLIQEKKGWVGNQLDTHTSSLPLSTGDTFEIDACVCSILEMYCYDITCLTN